MLRLQLPERSSFRFGRKSFLLDDKEKVNALGEVDIDLKIPPHIPLPMVHHTSTKSLFDLFQPEPQNESAYELQTKKNENKPVPGPLAAPSVPEGLQEPVLEDPSFPHGDATMTSSMPTITSLGVPPLVSEHDHSTASTPSSGFREDDDGSGCSRKSSTSSVETPHAGHKAYFEAMAAPKMESGLAQVPQPDTKRSNSTQEPEIAASRSVPQYDKPLPEPPSPERPFSVSSVLSIMRAESFSKTAQQPSMQMLADAPVIFRRQSQIRPGHGRSASEGILRSKSSTIFKPKSPPNSPRSKRGARLGTAMSQGRPHSRAQTLSNIVFSPLGSEGLKTTRPLNLSLNNIPIATIPTNETISLDRFAEEPPISISPSSAERVVFEIMRRLDDPTDLLATAAVNRGFRSTFKRGEPRLVHELLLRQCSPAWEFQKNSAKASGEPLSLRAYTKDKAALQFIKSALLASGDSILQPETVAGLVGADMARKSRIDSALWRIWTFCKGFGHRSLSLDDLPLQVDWLNGGRIARARQSKTAVGRGNGKGVSTAELEDLLELWDSLGAMLASFNSDVTEARAVGIFDKCTIDDDHPEEWFLTEWIYYIRSLGLPAVLSASSATSFEQAQASGFTDWTPPVHGQTRAGFFRTAVTSVYQERILAEAATKATQFALPPRSQHRPTTSDASISSLEQLTRALERHAAKPQPLKINTSPIQVRRKPLSPSLVLDSSKPNTTWQPETPDTPYPVRITGGEQVESENVERQAEHSFQRDSFRDSLASPVKNALVLQSLGMTSTASTRIGATLFPMEYPPTSPKTPVRSPVSHAPPPRSLDQRQVRDHDDVPAVIDPVDKAMRLLTQDMGFSAADASRALAKCDTGFGIDVEKAIEMLAAEFGNKLSASSESRAKTPPPASPVKALTPPSPVKPQTPRETYTSHQEIINSVESAASFEVKPFEPLCDTYPVRQPSILGNLNRNSFKNLARMTSKAKASRLLGMDRSEKANRPLSIEDNRSPRVASLKAIHSDAERPWQALPGEQRPVSKMPPRKAKDANKPKLMGIDEEPSVKAMKVLGVDGVEIKDGRISPATGAATTAKSKSAKRFYEGRFGNLGWSDAGSVN